ncbi:hypothetical protein IJU97_05625 [bacterium]|nr:hypothetical protein [bacterium]
MRAAIFSLYSAIFSLYSAIIPLFHRSNHAFLKASRFGSSKVLFSDSRIFSANNGSFFNSSGNSCSFRNFLIASRYGVLGIVFSISLSVNNWIDLSNFQFSELVNIKLNFSVSHEVVGT